MNNLGLSNGEEIIGKHGNQNRANIELKMTLNIFNE
jgi:hypothetical protein